MARVTGSKFVPRALAALVFALVLSVWIMCGRESLSVATILSWLHEHPIIAPFVFVVAHVVAAVAFLPCSPFTLLAGLLWSLPYSLAISVAAALCASCTTFLLGRYFWPRALRSKFNNVPMQKLMGLSDKHGWQLVALTHINPALPSSTLGYIFGLSKISFRLYAWSAFVGMLPLQIALVAMGSAVRDLILSRVWIAACVSIAIAAAALGLWFALKRKSKNIEPLQEENNGN